MFIALAVVAGIPTAIIYALVRIGDRAAVTAKHAEPQTSPESVKP
jgi:hypothetical protein